jgi:lipopolysaccharide biosynthesis glycosyltransferase
MKIFVGWDSREDIAYQVCRHSIITRQPNAEVYPLKQHELRDKELYTREIDTLASTEFTFTRFLVPHLCNYEGWAVFVDCDVIWLEDIKELFAMANDDYAVMVVQHNYDPPAGTKMDGKLQYPYPRKNWSSMILWNCGHPSNKALTPEIVNSKEGAYLHRFQWLEDNEIGNLLPEWNWLVNWYKEPKDGKPKAIHYTEGGPWFPNYMSCEYGAYWIEEKYKYIESNKSEPPPKPYENPPPELEKIFVDLINYRVDPLNEVYDTKIEDIIEEVKMVNQEKAFAVEGFREDDGKGQPYDPFLKAFIIGCGGRITSYDKVAESKTPVVFRGITKSKHMRKCEEAQRDYFYIDTGYFGNGRKKLYHRITKNSMQNVGPVINRPFDRLEATGIKPAKFRKGRNILLCPPSAKAMANFGLDLDKWLEEIVSVIKTHSDRPIIVRTKPSRRERVTTDTIEMALANDVHCLVTFNSIAASEALICGKPAFTLGPNAAQSLCYNDLTKIETPYIPTRDELMAWAAHLAYCQFTEAEMRNGTAWRILNDEV